MASVELSRRQYPESPGWMLVNTGEESEIDRVKERFFGEVLDYLGYPKEKRQYFYKVVDYYAFPTEWMIPGVHTKNDRTSDGRTTDTSVSVLTLGPDHVVAFEIRTRTAFNRVQSVIGHCLSPEFEEQVKFRPREE